MEYLNILDKMGLLWKLVSNNYLFIAILAISMTVFIINRLKLINNKKMGLIITLSFVLGFTIILFYNSNSLFKMFDNIFNMIFRNIYFPSLYVYIAIILITNIILILSIVSTNMSKLYKNINKGMAFAINFLLLILINTVGSNDIDILSSNSMYTNNYFVTLIELTTSVFILWMLVLLIISIINSILLIIENKKMGSEAVEMNDICDVNKLEVSINEQDINKNLEVHPLYKDSKVVTSVIDVKDKLIDDTSSNVISNNDVDKKVLKVENINNSINFNDFVKKENVRLDSLRNDDSNNGLNVLMNMKPVIVSDRKEKVIDKKIDENNYIPEFNKLVEKQEEKKLDLGVIMNSKASENIEHKYTKEDYKLFYDMLNQVKADNDGKSIITMDDALSVNLLNKFSISQYNLYKKMLEDVK